MQIGISINKYPLLDIGDLGCFDENGVAYPWILSIDEKTKYLYYVGWIKGGKGGFINAAGIAISKDGGKNYKRLSRAPMLGRSDEEPISIGSQCIRMINGKFKMWYTCFDRWEQTDDGLKHYYNIKYAESDDGIKWQRNIAVAITFKNTSEYSIAKPCVVYEGGIYKMWYSYRGPAYRIGYAESTDGILWQRKDHEVGIDVGGEKAWDSDMLCYAYVFNDGGNRYMLYNGNGYGQTGIGLAILDS